MSERWRKLRRAVRRWRERCLAARARRYYRSWHAYGTSRRDAWLLTRYGLRTDRLVRAYERHDRFAQRIAARLDGGLEGARPRLEEPHVVVRIDGQPLDTDNVLRSMERRGRQSPGSAGRF